MAQMRVVDGNTPGGDGLHRLEKGLSNAARRSRQVAGERPLLALAVAVVTGYCLGRIASRI